MASGYPAGGEQPSGRLVVLRPLRLLRRRRRLLPDLLLPVRRLREDRGDRRPGSHIVLRERDAVHVAGDGDGVRVRLLLLLPLQAAPAVRAPGEALRRLLRPLVLRALRPLPGVPRAQEPRLRHVPRMAGEHGEDGEGRRDCPAADAPGDDSLVRVCVRGHVGLRCADQASACVGSVASSRQGMPTCKVDVKLVFSFCYISSCRESHEL
uniref:Uncharacterized protein n=1 Tax=Oryza glaberrima TaxID=4538 RepID=I1PLY3_ORYGL